MDRTIEWRTKNAYDSLLVVCESGTTSVYQLETAFSPATPQEIEAMVTALGDLRDWRGNGAAEGVAAPDYGNLVLKLDENGGKLVGDLARIKERLVFLFGARAAVPLLAAVQALGESPALAAFQGLLR